jgi:uncharacterized protein YciI
MGRVLLGFLFAGLCLGQQAGTQHYIFGFLRVHPERTPIPAAAAMEIQKGHMAHLMKMANDGTLVAAGPLADSPDLRGIVIFKGITLDQARQAAEADPAVVAKRLRVDAAEWTGPPGIGEATAALMRANPGANIPMTKRTLVVYWRTGDFPSDLAGDPARQVLAGHEEFVSNLRREKGLLAIGPMLGSKEFVGLAVWEGEDYAAAVERCRAQDPMVKAGWVKPQGFVLYIAEATFARP